MTKEEIYSTLDSMYENQKSKTFINHLVRSYIPVTNIVKVLDTPETEMKCVITKQPLVSIQKIFEETNTESFKTDVNEHIKSMFSANYTLSPISKLLAEKQLAFTGKDTTTYMSYSAAQEFYNWVLAKAFSGDKHMNWLLGSINRKTLIRRAEEVVGPQIKRSKNSGSRTTFSLSENNDVLAKLKTKMESDGI